jgi:hypothetical protein
MNNANSVFYINRRNKNKKCSIRKTWTSWKTH